MLGEAPARVEAEASAEEPNGSEVLAGVLGEEPAQYEAPGAGRVPDGALVLVEAWVPSAAQASGLCEA